MIRETNELRHIRNVRKALLEIQLADITQKEEPNSSQKTYQTIKCEWTVEHKLDFLVCFDILIYCRNDEFKYELLFVAGMIALKRKLKRIRENKEQTSSSQ